MLASDVNEAQLLGVIKGQAATIVVTPIGGQGYIFGRGNQQISPEVIRRVTAGSDRPYEHITVVGATSKIHSLGGRPLLVDTGDPALDQLLSGHVRVVTGYGEEIVYPVSS
jgi:predicted polyphosphate/ATP-dependent NAD kinase